MKSVLVTGSSSGIGLATCHYLKDRGYNVIASCRKATDCGRLRQEGFSSCVIDLADSDSVKNGFAEAVQLASGKLFGLFNNGAYGQPGAVEDLSRDCLRTQFETNVFGTHELTCLAVAHMRKNGEGRIIQNSSVLGLVTLPFRGAYNSSKHALEGLSDTLRLELRGSNVFVSTIEPGPIESKFRENAFAAYKKFINAEVSFHKEQYAQTEKRLQHQGAVAKFTLPPEAVAAKVLHALTSKNPNPRYYVTFPTYLMGTLKRLLSTRMMDYAIVKLG